MNIKTLEELQAPDERALIFTPLGLGRMTPEDAADLQQRVIARLQLAADVAETTRNKFEQLRTAYSHGVLCYELFTLVGDAAQLTLEQALRDRFAAHYTKQVVEVRDRKRREHQIIMTSSNDFFDKLRKIHAPQLRMGPLQEWEPFNGMLGGLLRWARREGLLRGQRNRSLDPVRQVLRNMVAHGTYHLDSPVEAARLLSDLAEIINHLWGQSTPGGRLYPAPLNRSVVAIGWSNNGKQTTAGYADHLAEAHDEEKFTYILVRAVFCPGGDTDPNLLDYDARRATTAFPAQYLWGPGSREEALAWLGNHQLQSDVCDHLDQVILVRVHDGQVDLPMYPGVAAGLPAAEQLGTWHTLRVDRGLDALSHVRHRQRCGRACAPRRVQGVPRRDPPHRGPHSSPGDGATCRRGHHTAPRPGRAYALRRLALRFGALTPSTGITQREPPEAPFASVQAPRAWRSRGPPRTTSGCLSSGWL
ncbi:hypothetical protein ABZ468_20020 [Streptomyces sp. NPDC005708]|uniref:hypothetical protein n=1 Tax=Streptomyces sp. NPDC005708 TaxID=3154564 RepID=UPI0033E5F400